jgi:hypothetical protein
MRSSKFFSILASLSPAVLFAATHSLATDLGRQLFDGGGNSGVAVTLESAGLTADAAQFPCAKCHGAAGLGTREADSAAPPLLPSLLFSQGPLEQEARAKVLRQAVVHGKSSSGGKLSAIMPRYDLPKDTEYELLSFLDALEARQRSGVSASSVRFGVIVPDPPVPAELALLDALSQAASKANDGKPIHGRRVEVVRLDTRSIQTAIDSGNIFAILALSTRTAGLAPLLNAEAVPMLFPLAEAAGDAAKTSVIASQREWISAVINDAEGRRLTELVSLDGSVISELGDGRGLRLAPSFAASRQTAILMTSREEIGAVNALPTDVSDVIYIAAPDPYLVAAEIKRTRASVVIVERFPALIDLALERGTNVNEAYAATVVETIKSALVDTGRFVTRATFLKALEPHWSRSPPGAGAKVRLLSSSD